MKCFHALTASPICVRGHDEWGSGEYGAPRGDRIHRGIDIVASPGETILCPFDAMFVRIAEPYDNDARFSGMLLRGTGEWAGYEAKLFYLMPDEGLKVLQAGEKIGVAQDIALRYPGITTHVHLELWQDGNVIDPTPCLPTEDFV